MPTSAPVGAGDDDAAFMPAKRTMPSAAGATASGERHACSLWGEHYRNLMPMMRTYSHGEMAGQEGDALGA